MNDANNTLSPGQPAPDFHGSYLDAQQNPQQISLADLAGKQLVLYFYPRDNTPGCSTEAVDFQSLLANFAECNTVVIGVSDDDLKSHAKFADKKQLTFTLIADTEQQIAQIYGVLKEKNMFGKKFLGVERSTFLIDQAGNIAEIWRKVKVPDHAEEVLKRAQILNK